MSVNPANDGVQSLNASELQLLDRVLRRIHDQFRAFLKGLPHEARNASGLARMLDVDRTTCQRLVFTANRPYGGLEMMERLPGVRGLGRLVEAARAAEPPVAADVLEPLQGAVRRLQESLAILGGSQSVLIRRIAASRSAVSRSAVSRSAVSRIADDPAEASGRDGDEPRVLRRRLFRSAAALTGRHSDVWVAVYAFHPSAATGAQPSVDVARVHGLIGHHATPDAVPLTFHNFGAERDHSGRPFSGLGAGQPAGVLPAFSTDPIPVVSAKQPGEYLVQAIDTDMLDGARAVDLVLGTLNVIPHPCLPSEGMQETWAMINFPVRSMVFDVYLHRDLARACIPALDVHLWRPDFASQKGDRWQTRFSDGPRLELLGRGLAQARAAVYPRHAELTRFLFSARGLEAEHFVGFRCAVDYPIWRTGYCMSFDFTGSQAEYPGGLQTGT